LSDRLLNFYNILTYANFIDRRFRNTDFAAPTNNWVMNSTGTQRKSATKSCSGILHDALKKTAKILRHRKKCSGRNSNLNATE